MEFHRKPGVQAEQWVRKQANSDARSFSAARQLTYDLTFREFRQFSLRSQTGSMIMTTAQLATPPDGHAPTAANPLLQALSGVFGTVFHICEVTSSSTADSALARSAAATFCSTKTAWKDPGAAAAAAEFSLGNGATVFHLPSGPAVLVVLTDSSQGRFTYIVGELPGADSDLVTANLKYAIRMACERFDAGDTAELVDSYAAQLSHAYEEISWLHQLSGQLEQFEVARSLQDVAEDTLPSLRNLLQAQAALFVSVRDDETVEYVNRLRVLHWSGGREISDSQACKLVATMRLDGNIDTVVRNRMAASGAVSGLREVDSMLLVPVAKGRQVFGWLMFLNRSGEASQLITNHDILGLDEFGTEEAGMAEAAASMLAGHARNVQLFEERETLMIGTIQSLVRTIEARDEYTCGHSDRVAKMSQMLACQLGVPDYECQRIYRAGLLHDIGKVGVPDQVLSKPGKLTDEEFDQIKQHPMIGYRILKDLKSFDYVLPGVRWHHERQDGRGYPDGLTGEEIPLMARVMAVADGLDAMTSNRPYRDGMPFEKAESILREGAGTQWDADVIAAYFEINELIQDYCRNHRMSSVMQGLEEVSPIAAM